jgi:hypothetical protein
MREVKTHSDAVRTFPGTISFQSGFGLYTSKNLRNFKFFVCTIKSFLSVFILFDVCQAVNKFLLVMINH